MGEPLLKPKKKKKKKVRISEEVYNKVLERDNHRCRLCYSTWWLQIHHIIYRSQGGKHIEENLMMLCKSCHDKVHSSKKTWQVKLKQMINVIYDKEIYKI